MSDSNGPERSQRTVGRLSPDERVELERRLGTPFALDGRFGSLWAVELLARTLRRVAAFRPLVAWIGSYVHSLFTRGYREAGFELLDLGEGMLGVKQPGYVYNLDDAVGRILGQASPTTVGSLSPVLGMALAPRAGLEAMTFGQPRLEWDRVRHRADVERLVDWLVAEQLRAAVGGDPELGEAGYEVARAIIAPSYGYVGSDGVAQVARVGELLSARPEPRGRVLLGLSATQDLYLATLAARCCLELGVRPTRELEARAMRRALRHFGGLPKSKREVLDAVDALLPKRESPIEGTDLRSYTEAHAAVAAGDPGRAYELLDGLCRSAPNRAAYFCYRGYVAELLGRPTRESSEDYDRALSLQPDYWQALINRGVLLSRHGHFAEADRDLFAARALRPDCDDTRNNLLLNHWFRRLPAAQPPVAAPPPARIAAAAPAEPPQPAVPLHKGPEASASADRSADEQQEDFSQYEILGLLGAGGMGKVYRVRHRGWDIELALKIPRVELLEQGGVAGFVEEAEAWSRLGSSPHTVDCHYVRMRKGVPWLFAEYVAGGSLADWIESGRLYEPGPDLPANVQGGVLGRLVDIGLQIAYGLHHAHANGLIHQDMKPANVLVTREGIAKVTDFGLAKVTRLAAPAAAPAGERKTMMAGFAGMTPAYCSPEQARAARSQERVVLTRRSDVWSWAVTVLEMFTGEIRWMSGVLAPASLERLRTEQDKPKSDRIPRMPAPLVALLRRCFALSEAERPADMLEIAAELREIYRTVTGGRAARPAPSAHDDVAVVLNNRGASLLDLGRADDAMAAWQQAVEAEPLHPEASYNLALGEWRRAAITDEEAVERVSAAVGANQGEWRVRLLAAWIHHERADRSEVMSACVNALRHTAADEAMLTAVRRPYRFCPEGYQDELQLDLPSVPHAVAISRDGRVGVTAHAAEICIWAFAGGSSAPVRFDGQAKLVSVSDDGALVAWAGDQGIVAARVAERASIRAEAERIGDLATCGNGAVVVALGDRVLVLDASGGTMREIGRHAGRVTGVAAVANGRLVASASEDGTVVLRLLDGQVTRTLRHEQPVDWVSLTADGKRAVSGGWDGERSQYRLHLWETVSGSLIRRLEEPGPRRAVLTDDGSHVLSWSSDGKLRLWEVLGGRCLRTGRPLGDVVAVHSTDADDVLCARGGKLHRIRVLHSAPKAPTMVARPRPSEVLEANHASFRGALRRAEQACEQGDMAAALRLLGEATRVPGYGRHRDAQTLASRIAHRTARGPLRTSYAGRTLRDLGGPVYAVGLDGDGAVATTLVYDDGARLVEVSRHDTRTGKRLSSLQVSERAGPLEASAMARDAPVVATSCGGTLRIWRLAEAESHVIDGESVVRALALSADGRLLWVMTPSVVACWDEARRRWLEPVPVPRPRAIAAAAECDRLVAASAPARADGVLGAAGPAGSVGVWSLARGAELHPLHHGSQDEWRLEGSQGDAAIERIALTPDARRAAILHEDGAVALVDVATGTTLLRPRSADASSMALSDDGTLLLLGARDGTVSLLDVRAGGVGVRLGRHRNEVMSLAVSRDGLIALSGGRDGDANLWHLEWERTLLVGGSLAPATCWLERFVQSRRTSQDEPFGIGRDPVWAAAELHELGRELGRLGFGACEPAALEAALRALSARAPARRPAPPAGPFDPSALPLRLWHEPHRGGRAVGRPAPLPLKILVVGDFGGAAAASPWPIRRIDEAMAALVPAVRLALGPNERLGTPAVEQQLELRSLASLRPDKLIEAFPEHARLYFTRMGLDFWASHADEQAELLSPLLGRLAERLRAGEAPKAAAMAVCDGPVCERIANLVANDERASFLARASLGGLLTLLVSHERTRVDGAAARWASETIEQGLGVCFDELLHAPHFRRLERSWRSLARAHDELIGSGPGELHLLDTGGAGAASTIPNATLHGVLEDAYRRDAPYTAIVLDAPLPAEPEGAGLALLAAVAHVARHAQAALLVGVEPALAAALASRPPDGWRSLFADPVGSHVALLEDSLLLRPPYRELRKIPYVEGAASGRAGVPLLGSGAYAGAISLGAAFERDGTLRLGVGQLRSPADGRAGARRFAVTLPLSRVAQHVRLRHEGFDRRDDLDASRAWLRRGLDELTADLSEQSGQPLGAALELGVHDAAHFRCDLWLMPRAAPAEAVATSLLLERH